MKKILIPFKIKKQKQSFNLVLFFMRLWIILFVLSVIIIVYIQYQIKP